MQLIHFGDRWIRGIWFSADGGTLIVAEGTERYPVRLHWHDLHQGKAIRTWRIPCGEFVLAPDFSAVAQLETEIRQSESEDALHIHSVGESNSESVRAQL